ncbi:MAG: PilN domain-containing protein [Planctomycetes bacterium]|nr:PilN domain-containing protein [Planctomycetota bacterium]MBI3832767.1 PilN domain-containing protein [Planctomycetota bacterium]
MEMLRFNLIPEAMRHARRRGRHVRRWVVVIAATALLDCIPLSSHWWSRRESEHLSDQANGLATEIKLLRADTKRLGSTADELYAQIERAKSLRGKRAWSAMLSMIANAMPTACWLTSFATEPEAPEGAAPQRREAPPSAVQAGDGGAPSKTPVVVIEAPRRLKLAGMARDASQPLAFVSSLRETGVFRTVTLERSFRGHGSDVDVFQFELICEW